MTTREQGRAGSLQLSDNARIVLERRYLARDSSGTPMETPEQLFRRVAHNIAQAELLYNGQNVDKVASQANAAERERLTAELDRLRRRGTVASAVAVGFGLLAASGMAIARYV